MTAADQLARADRQRLEERLAELRDLDALMRQPGTLCAPREGRDDDTTEGTAAT